ncbi:MAG: ABC transporter permease [Phycisphaerales bacterium]|nr:ABC transporter permease [Phycisphaerales bacterium]
MIKVFHVASREFLATVLTKGFLFGILFPPLMIGLVSLLMPALMNKAAPKVKGHVAVIDHSGQVATRLADAFSEKALRDRRDKRHQDMLDESGVPESVKNAAPNSMATTAMAQTPDLALKTLPPDADVEAAKGEIRQQAATAGKNADPGADPRLALVVIPKEAVQREPGKPYKGFDLFVAPKLDIEVRGDIESQVKDAIVDARISAANLDAEAVKAITRRPDASTTAITSSGEKKGSEAAQFLIPAAFMLLLWISVFTCGQYLLSSTIEEKSNRVMEVLLSAVSPIQLMAGKILGQMFVGIVILCLYGSAGVFGLIAAAYMDFVDFTNLIYLGIYFVIAFSLIACLMAAVGSAVNDIREAQSLLGPIMIVLVIPMMLWMPILRNPNSTFAQIASFVPPIGPFVMVLRVAGSEKIPTWQIPATIVVGFLWVGVFLWATAKIFRIGVLMYGKAPNFGTLIRWIRMA